MRSLGFAFLFLVLTVGCASAPVNDKSARAAFQQIENHLLSAGVLRVDYQIEARGAVTAKLDGDLVMQKPALAAINASGRFAGADVAPVLVSDGKRMRGGVAPHYFDGELAADLRGGLLVGLMRMGILHNLAKLASGAAPDATDGGVRKWVAAKGFEWVSSSRSSFGNDLRGIRFSIVVGGEPAGDAVLWYDPQTGLPVEREQVVHFDAGDMHVNERYEIETDGMIGPCRFDLDAVPSPAH